MNLRENFIRLLMHYCCKRAKRYEDMKQMLLDHKGYIYIYTIGSLVHNRDIWLGRLKWLDDLRIKVS